MRMTYGVLAAVGLLLGAVAAEAAVSDVKVVQVPQAVVDGYTVNRVNIDFEGFLRGQQMILSLTQGSIFQQLDFGADTPVSSALWAAFPDTEFDTFVAIGGRQSNGDRPPATQPILVVGGAANLEAGAALKFDTEGINIAWAPGTGVDVPNGLDYLTSQITLSNDAQGMFQYFGSTAAGTGDPLVMQGSVVNGAIVFGGDPILPVVDDLVLDPIDVINGMSMGTVTGSDVDTWSSEVVLDSYVPGFGAGPAASEESALAPVFDTETLKFSWDSTGAYPGTYSWLVSGSNADGSDTGLVSVELRIPEPASIALLGLAIVGFAGFRRKQ